ncbi:MAG: cytochrome c biogenesis protein ResB, partial [Planctomycetia bacterium]|nr:cytochrome c biogenesis protein ResB [Planctomycetia bacterium]
MSRIRRIVLWLVLGTIGLLVVLSVIGAFLGAERATVLFNSVPMAVFWILLAAIFISGFIFFKNLVRFPGLLAVHIGSLLILAGAMYGSDAGHWVAAKVFDSKKIPFGYVILHQGESSSGLRAVEEGRFTDEIDKLPFSIKLKRFWIERYPPEKSAWDLGVSFQSCKGHGKGKEQDGDKSKRIHWAVGKEVAIPFTDARLKVLKYIESARSAFVKDAKPTLEIALPDGKVKILSAEVGSEVSLEDPKVTLRVVQVLANLRVKGRGDDVEVFDLGGRRKNPALKVEVEQADGTKKSRYVMPGMPMHGKDKDGLKLRCRFPMTVEADPSTGVPAMEVLLSRKGKQQREWLVVRKGAGGVSLSLLPFLGAAFRKDAHCEDDAQVTLLLVKPLGQIKDYKSDLV